MRWDFGTVYQTIRKSKGLSQTQVCGDQISRATLSKIENNKEIPNVENMVFLLHQIDMTLEEFEYICNYYQPSQRQKFLNRLYRQKSWLKTGELESFIQDLETYLKKEHDVPLQNILDAAKIVCHIHQNGIHSKDTDFLALTDKIWKQLEKQDQWYYDDLKHLGTILYHFPLETLPAISDRILKNLEKYQNYRAIAPLQSALLTNLSTVYLTNKVYDQCLKICQYGYDVSKAGKRFDSQFLFQVRLGICQKKPEMVKQGLDFFALIGDHKTLQQLEGEVADHYPDYDKSLAV